MEHKPSNFSVDSKGYCFLCLNKISPQIRPIKSGEGDPISSPSVYSLQDISRYLKIDMRKVFIQGGPVPPHLIAKVEKSNLKVELCEECASKTKHISKLCRQLDKLKMEIESGLEFIQGKMFEADETGRTEQFQGVAGSELNSGMGGWMDILEVLRMEAMQKCSSKIHKASPRLRVQRLSTKEIHRRTLRTPNLKAEATSDRMSNPGADGNRIETEETCYGANWTMEDDGYSENLFGNDLDDNPDDSISTFVKDIGEPTEGSMMNTKVMRTVMMRKEPATGNDLQLKWIINPSSGKYKCQHCSMEYASQKSVERHYNTAHRKLRYKCKICGKEFTQQSTYKRHHQNLHMDMGIRFQCQICKKIFSLKHHLMAHQRKGGCAIGVGKN